VVASGQPGIVVSLSAERGALESARASLAEQVRFHEFTQWVFADAVEEAGGEAAAARGIRFIGDLPIFVAYHSADVWAHRELFTLDEQGPWPL